MLKITKVKRNSIAKQLGLEIGDEILAFDGYACEDELDYLYYLEAERFTMLVRDKRKGEENTVTVEKESGEDIGLTFEKNTKIRTCHNRCVFCFVDQMPKGMRDSLYVKDDDYSMSFTCGNFVTLTNLSDESLERIIRLKLSPLYISVHTMNGALRVELLRNRHAGKIAAQIERLAQGGIEMHCQAVIVPDKNDGDELRYTARELFKYYPTVKDLACVPTGLTKYRLGLTEIPDVGKEYSERFLDIVDELNKEFGVNFVLPADEYFVKAERKTKEPAFYGEFEQLENGVGMTTKFLCEAREALNALPSGYALKKPKRSLIVCGVSAGKVLAPLVKEYEKSIDGLTVELLPVENDFFGKTVTCTGLLTGRDIVRAVEAYRLERGEEDEILLSGSVLREFEDVFLCGMTLKEMKKRLKTKNIRINRDGGNGFTELLASESGSKRR